MIFSNLEALRANISSEVYLISLELEGWAKQPFIKIDKRGESNLVADYTKWKTLDNYATAAENIVPGFKEFWEVHEKTLPKDWCLNFKFLEMYYALWHMKKVNSK